jgi:dihydrofolate synthase/folylpolyglutamate synthase
MDYQQTIDWLFQALPMYQRIGDQAIKKDLTNIRKLSILLNDPHDSFQTIHVAGTNGKGSTSHMLAAIFQAAGYKTGLYTSPHYIDFRERIKVNGSMISEQAVVDFVEQYKIAWQPIEPSFFEITVAMAFDYFRAEHVDIAIIETGLGGRLDSTNIITPMLSVITNIGYDHMQMLGNTLPQIAFEKAGIIKENIPVVIGEWHDETAPVFEDKAAASQAPIYFTSQHIAVDVLDSGFKNQLLSVTVENEVWFEKLACGLTGAYQVKNVATVLESIWRWNKYYPDQQIREEDIREGMANVSSMTNMIGRWMVLDTSPIIITDAAHNEHGMKAMLPKLLAIECSQRHFVLGFVGDKLIDDILSLFPADARYYWCAPNIPRGKPASETQAIGEKHGLRGDPFESVDAAYIAARKQAVTTDLIFIGGSSYVVGDLLAATQNKTGA